MKDMLLHNPRCTKSRQALDLLESRGITVPVRRYLDDPPTRNELAAIVKLLGVRPIAICRKGEAVYQDLGISEAMPDEDVLELMAANPVLIERPIFIYGNRAVIGRPTERILELL